MHPPRPGRWRPAAPDLPPALAPVSTLEVADAEPGAPGQAGIAATSDPAAPQTVEADVPNLLTAYMPESAPEVAEAAAAPELQPAAPEPPTAVPSQFEAANPGPVPAPFVRTPPAVETPAGPDAAPGTTVTLPAAAHLTVPMPAAREARANVLPAAPRPPARSAAIRPERVADRLPAPGWDGQRCRGIILRLQLGETPTDGDRTFLRNGCR